MGRGAGSLVGEKANGIRDLTGVGEGFRCDSRAGCGGSASTEAKKPENAEGLACAGGGLSGKAL